MSETVKWSALTSQQRDQLIAEKVMGLELKECNGTMGEQPISSDGWFCMRCGYEGYWGDGFDHTELPRHYTTSMDAAWLVVEKMKEAGRNNGLFVPWQYHLSYLYGRPSYRDTLYDLNAEGVCIAALRAVGLQVEYEVQS